MKAIARRFAAATSALPAESVALIVAVGLVLGTFPVYGCPTILCAAAAFALRLNPTVLQLVNQIATPAQLALLPFVRSGTWCSRRHWRHRRACYCGMALHAWSYGRGGLRASSHSAKRTPDHVDGLQRDARMPLSSSGISNTAWLFMEAARSRKRR